MYATIIIIGLVFHFLLILLYGRCLFLDLKTIMDGSILNKTELFNKFKYYVYILIDSIIVFSIIMILKTEDSKIVETSLAYISIGVIMFQWIESLTIGMAYKIGKKRQKSITNNDLQ